MATNKLKQLAALEKLIAEGLTFGEAAFTFAKFQTDNQNDIAAKGRKLFEDEGTIEFDDTPIVSSTGEGGDNGSYVMAWVWVDGEKNED